MRKIKLIGLSLVFFQSLTTAASKTEDLNIEKLEVSPDIISPSGKNRIRDHIGTIQQNILHTESNLQATKKNIEVIELELKDLEDLETEHLRLRDRYKDFLSHASSESLKNEKALNEIEDFERKAQKLTQNTSNAAQLNELQIASNEKNERMDWSKDSNQKIKRVKELLVGIEKNLESIASRRRPLVEQLQHWKTKGTDYNQLLVKLNEKKVRAERFLATQPK